MDNGGLTAHTVIQANVEDVNDHAPVFAKENYEFRVTEGNYSMQFGATLSILWPCSMRIVSKRFNLYLGSYKKARVGEVLASDADIGPHLVKIAISLSSEYANPFYSNF